MKTLKHTFSTGLRAGLIFCTFFGAGHLSYAQDSTATAIVPKPAPSLATVKNTFAGSYLIDNQTVMIPAVKTFEFAIQHRFGTVNNGYSDMYGIFAPANIRLGFSYVVCKNLQLGFGITKDEMQWDGNLKYAFCKQNVSGGCPVSITYYGDMAISTLPLKGNFVSDNDRYTYFNQIIIARKVTDRLSLQVAPSISYFNNVPAYMSSDGITVKPLMNNSQYAIACMGRYKLTDAMSVIADYDQPLTQNPANNPRPNISFGLEMGTTGHSFQLFVGDFQHIIPQANNFLNQNDFKLSQYCVGFNITRRFYH